MPNSQPGTLLQDCVREDVVGRDIVVELRGEIDILSAPVISAHLDSLGAERLRRLVVDLRPVTFMDCSGLSVLCRTRRRLMEHGVRLRLVVGDPRILRILRMTGLLRAFDIHGSVRDALAAGSGTADGQPAPATA